VAPGDAEAAAVPEAAAGDEPGRAEDVAAVPEHSTVPEDSAAPEHPALPEEHAAVQEHAVAAHTANGSGPAAPLVESTQIRRAIAIAQKRTELNWSVFIGTLTPDPRAQAEARHAELGPAAGKSVLIAVDPAARRLEIVTGTHARKYLDDRSCGLAAAAMTSSFAVRDLDGGIANGILAMVEHVRNAA
jgi:hypothetical protein